MEEESDRCTFPGFEDGGRGHEPLETRKGKETDSPLSLQKGLQPCQTLILAL